MSLHNLATVFGPTLLRPSEGESKGHLTLASDIWSHDVMAQVRAELVGPGPSPCQHPEGFTGLSRWTRPCLLEVAAWGKLAPGSSPLSGPNPPPICLPQVQVLLYYLQHPPISFTELKRNTLYFSTDV